MNRPDERSQPERAREPANGLRSLVGLLEAQHARLRAMFTQWTTASPPQRGSLQGQLLLGLELILKVEEQVLLPAMKDAAPSDDAQQLVVSRAAHELDLMRDLAVLANRSHSSQRELAMAVLEGMAMLHFARVGELLAGVPADATDWPVLEREVRGLFDRWHEELKTHGEIEDEDRDPVGLPPR